MTDFDFALAGAVEVALKFLALLAVGWAAGNVWTLLRAWWRQT